MKRCHANYEGLCHAVYRCVRETLHPGLHEYTLEYDISAELSKRQKMLREVKDDLQALLEDLE